MFTIPIKSVNPIDKMKYEPYPMILFLKIKHNIKIFCKENL